MDCRVLSSSHVKADVALCLFNVYLLAWLHQAFVVARGSFSWGARHVNSLFGTRIFTCSMWDLVPRTGIEPELPAPGVWSVSPWTTRDVPNMTVLYFE